MMLTRRHLLASCAAAAGSSVFAQRAPAGSLERGRLIVVLLRGAYDGLSALVPYSDKDYYAIRPNISIAAPNGTREAALKLDEQFGMHPALEPLLPLWQQGLLAAIPCAGLTSPNRSHFDAQYLMETALSEKVNAASGWMNRLATAQAGRAGSILGVGEANPAILAGKASVKLIPSGESAERSGALANTRARTALADLYEGQGALSEAYQQGAASRMQTTQELSTERSMLASSVREQRHMRNRMQGKDGSPMSPTALQAQMLAANNGALDATGLVLDAQHLATLMRNDRRLRLGFLSAGGWDTHANQGAVSGQLANNLRNLANGLAQLASDFNDTHDTIMVMSEFGRTAAENGTRGTDHGFGNALWLIGKSVNGGQIHGTWSGMARGNLNENRDLPAHHDYRAVIAQALRSNFALPDSQLQTLLPGAQWDSKLDGLFKRT